jgi:hypothetical protein
MFIAVTVSVSKAAKPSLIHSYRVTEAGMPKFAPINMEL